MIKTDRKILLALLYVKDLFAYSCSYLQSWGDHSMHRNVLPWYPGGHALSKMHGRHLYLQHGHGEGSHKEKLQSKEDSNQVRGCMIPPIKKMPHENTQDPPHPCLRAIKMPTLPLRESRQTYKHYIHTPIRQKQTFLSKKLQIYIQIKPRQ